MPTTMLPAERHGPTYWFVKLDQALQDGDWPEVADAAAELRALGVNIQLDLNRVNACVAEGDRG